MAPPKANDVKALVRVEWKSVLDELGFRRTPRTGLLSWYRPVGDQFILFWMQFGKWNYGDDPMGYTFTVEFQAGDTRVIGTGDRRGRLPRLLTFDQLERMRELNNGVHRRARVSGPPYEDMSAKDRRVLEDAIAVRDTPYDLDDDVWFRYLTVDDVRAEVRFIASVLSDVVDAFSTLAGRGDEAQPADSRQTRNPSY